MTKPWSSSYSKVKNYDACPKKHYEVDIAKNYADSGEAMLWGNEVHHALAAAALHASGLPAQGTGRDRVEPKPLPDQMKDYQKWIDVVAQSAGELFVERKYAITKTFQPTSWFGNDVWFRGVCDLEKIKNKTCVALDWKTGKILHDSRQLMLMTTCILAHHPEVDTVKTRFVWLKDGCTTPETFERATIMKEWPPMLAKLQEMEQAALTLTYPPKPSGLCRGHCPVTSCVFHGKGARR